MRVLCFAVLNATQCTLFKPALSVLDLRRQAGHHELAERLVEIQYELTDRLTFYLCGRRPGECPARIQASC